MITASFKDENGQPVTPNGINWTLTDIWGNVITNCSSETLTTAQSVTVVLSGEDLPLQSFDDDGYQALLINCTYDSIADSRLPIKDEARFSLQDLWTVTGDNDSVPIDQVAQKIQQNPALMVELQRLAVEREIGLARAEAEKAKADTERVRAVNATMSAESKSEKWPQYAWRPFNGFLFGLAIVLIYFV